MKQTHSNIMFRFFFYIKNQGHSEVDVLISSMRVSYFLECEPLIHWCCCGRWFHKDFVIEWKVREREVASFTLILQFPFPVLNPTLQVY